MLIKPDADRAAWCGTFTSCDTTCLIPSNLGVTIAAGICTDSRTSHLPFRQVSTQLYIAIYDANVQDVPGRRPT